MPSEKFERKVLITAAVAAAVVRHDRLVILTLTKARQQTNTPNTRTYSLSPTNIMVLFAMHGIVSELSLEVGLRRLYGLLGAGDLLGAGTRLLYRSSKYGIMVT